MSIAEETSPLLGGSATRITLWNSKRRYWVLGTIVILCCFLIFDCIALGSLPYLKNFNSSFPDVFAPIKLRVYTNNIRFDNSYGDPLEEPWFIRKSAVASSINFHTTPGHSNIVCLQEVLDNQLDDILHILNNEGERTDWTYYGVGRSDGIFSGEYSPILFKESEWRLIEGRTFWLSPTPDFPSKGWDAALERIVTMVTVQSKTNPGILLNFFNTHFDHRGKEARRHSLELIVSKMKNYNDYPSFLCGDFNTEPKDEPYHILTKSGFKDSRLLVDFPRKYGHEYTFTGFDKENEGSSIIDYIWAPYFAENTNRAASMETCPTINYFNSKHHESHQVKIESFGVLHNYFNRFYFSDHRPVVADFEVSRTLH